MATGRRECLNETLTALGLDSRMPEAPLSRGAPVDSRQPCSGAVLSDVITAETSGILLQLVSREGQGAPAFSPLCGSTQFYTWGEYSMGLDFSVSPKGLW